MELTTDELPEDLLDALGCDTSASLRTINDSLINSTYCLSSEGERFLIKRFLADESTGRHRRSLFVIQQKLAAAGIAPKPLFLCDQTGFFAEEWITPSLSPVSVLPEEERIRCLANALSKIHGLSISTSVMDLPAQWDAYITAANLTSDDVRVKQSKKLVFVANSASKQQEHLVFCHNDLAMNHVINHENLRIIDWEYSATGNRFFDIASAIVINRLNHTQSQALIATYAQILNFDFAEIERGVLQHEPLVSLTYQLWYAAITQHVKQVP